MKMVYRRFLSILFIILVVGLPGVLAQGAGKPNIILILADDMGYGDLASYGQPLTRTTNLDQMAREGIRLTSFYVAASTCTPSRAALMTGRYPLRSGLPNVIFPEEQKGLPSSEITIADLLKAQGYRTMCVGKWHLGQTDKSYLPLSHGFEHYFGLITSNDMKQPWVQTDVPLHLWRDMEPTNEFPVDQETLVRRYTNEAISFIKSSRGKPFFLYLPHNMPHVPLSVDKQYKGKSAAGLYGDVIENIDRSVGEILKTLRENKLDKNTVVIFMSDNGPWNNMPDRMFKEDIVKPWDAGSTGLLRGGKGNSYEGGFRVPCIIRWPARIPAGQTTSQVATSMDLLPTLVHLAGGEVPKDRDMDGMDVLPILLGDTAFRRSNDFYYYQGIHLEGIRSGAWKLRVSKYVDVGATPNAELKPQLFNLLLDPSERRNRAEEHPEIVAALMEKLKAMQMPGSVKSFE